ncbi:hypothetical protein HYC85_007950, partial [Camellia sinensis]
LAENSITGAIPASLSQCHNLRVINLGFNKLTGHLPLELGALPRLQVIDASGNNHTGVVPPHLEISLMLLFFPWQQTISLIGHLSNLLYFQLSVNEFFGEFPLSIFNISSLVYLSVAQNNFYGNLSSDVGFSLANIEQLYLGKTIFEDQYLSHCSMLQEFKSLISLQINFKEYEQTDSFKSGYEQSLFNYRAKLLFL